MIQKNNHAEMNGQPHRSPRFKPSQSLTQVEISSRNNLRWPWADGHMGWYDAPWMEGMPNRLPHCDATANRMTDREVEYEYFDAFMNLFKQFGSEGVFYKVLPSASLSIDVVTALAKRRGMRMQLIEPVFDNLYLYSHERGIQITPLPEEHLRTYGADAISSDVDMVFIVNPNNPTGFTLTESEFREIADRCARHRITLAIDASFRAYDLSGTDHYSILRDEGCSWITIEDTGKTFPTRERKASILCCSNDLKKDLAELVEIHVLGWSSPVLLYLKEMIDAVGKIGISQAIIEPTQRRRAAVRQNLKGTYLRPTKIGLHSTLPVEFLEITDDRFSDELLTQHMAKYSVGVLPGHHFFWSESTKTNRFIRVALLKPEAGFLEGLIAFRSAILSVEDSL
jgi:aspartate/methionine/tyrosine aminotransferase